MPHTAKHGHQPSDAEIEKHGYRAFAPSRPPLVPTPDQFQRALADCATGDPEEGKLEAERLADLWPGCGYHGFFWGYPGIDDD